LFFEVTLNFVCLNCQVCQPEGREEVFLLLMLEVVSSNPRMAVMGRRRIAELLLCSRGPSLVTGTGFLV